MPSIRKIFRSRQASTSTTEPLCEQHPENGNPLLGDAVVAGPSKTALPQSSRKSLRSIRRKSSKVLKHLLLLPKRSSNDLAEWTPVSNKVPVFVVEESSRTADTSDTNPVYWEHGSWPNLTSSRASSEEPTPVVMEDVVEEEETAPVRDVVMDDEDTVEELDSLHDDEEEEEEDDNDEVEEDYDLDEMEVENEKREDEEENPALVLEGNQSPDDEDKRNQVLVETRDGVELLLERESIDPEPAQLLTNPEATPEAVETENETGELQKTLQLRTSAVGAQTLLPPSPPIIISHDEDLLKLLIAADIKIAVETAEEEAVKAEEVHRTVDDDEDDDASIALKDGENLMEDEEIVPSTGDEMDDESFRSSREEEEEKGSSNLPSKTSSKTVTFEDSRCDLSLGTASVAAMTAFRNSIPLRRKRAAKKEFPNTSNSAVWSPLLVFVVSWMFFAGVMFALVLLADKTGLKAGFQSGVQGLAGQALDDGKEEMVQAIVEDTVRQVSPIRLDEACKGVYCGFY